MKFSINVSVNCETSNFHILADTVEEALYKTADIFGSMGMTGDSMNISIFKEANFEQHKPAPKKKYWKGNDEPAEAINEEIPE